MAEGAQGAAFTAELRKQVVTGLGHMFGDAESSVWIDFSDHSNVGDSAIWLGQVQVMQELGIEIAAVVPTAACTLAVIEPTLRRFPDATVAIQGGGNFGGLYSNHHQARLAGLQASANRTVVQAPQSVHFVSDAAKDELRQACRAPGRLATAVRDEFSLKRMRDLDPAAILLPDIAHCIAPLTAPPPVKAVQILRRTDREAPPAQATGLQGNRDWLRDDRLQRLAWSARSATYRVPAGRSVFSHVPPAVYTRIAQRRVSRGVAYLAKGQTIVTDRLHAMILGLHIGRRVIAVDNAIGKLRAYHHTWLEPLGAPVTFAGSWDDALRLARSDT
ncbi:polysaccharide pyruvyl transferase family protein [Williamsia sp. DF01-3]|uniref:polysaccharide pyruvyl transferase family protein n=1 Tax=Williamsia sp. DF01-3 TaxID=2934157 RepID=UPI0027E36E49|nr:polysaccharide pyruvyl transferase family protein [Williamsia sp. DF01-3]